MSLLVISKTLQLFVDRSTGDENYFLLNIDNLTEPVQTQLAQKQKGFF